MENPYDGAYGTKSPKVQTIRDTGAVTLYGPEIEIVDTPEFQRLGGTKQLGTSYVVFRGAVHTRFEHSLGTLQQAQNMVDAVNRSAATSRDGRIGPAKRAIDARGTRLARLAALLHDLPHVPFGHTLEDEFHLLMRHDKNVDRLQALLVESRIGEILREALAPEEVDDLLTILGVSEPHGDDDEAKAVSRLGSYAYVMDIVANTVCADLLDYIVRDLSACGMPVALGTRFLDYFEITPDDVPQTSNRNRLALRLDKRGMPRPDVESEILKLLTYRYELAERVFFHHAKNAASVMIGEAVALLALHEHDTNFHWLSDDALLAALAAPTMCDALKLPISEDAADRAGAAELGAMVQRRRLYKLVYLGVADDDVSSTAGDLYARWGGNPARRAVQDELAAKAGLERARVLVHLPNPKMMVKLAQVKVLLGDDTVTTFEDWEGRHSDRVRALNRAHQRLWRVGVYLHPDDYADEAKARLVHTAARETFRLPSRYARVAVEAPYLEAVYDLVASERGWPTERRRRHLEQAAHAMANSERPGTLSAAVDLLDGVIREDIEASLGKRQPADPQSRLDVP
jgi:uncharacterized protein